ncbi:MAG: hypothetical protein K9L19_18450 [Desulfarculaceae bacterium]|nr:hypothetical protein [Desulfarculaceae bacterium]
MVEQQILNGMKEISATVGRSEETVLSLKRRYPSMPIRKISHVWTSERSVLLDWWRRYAMGEITEPETEAPPQQKQRPEPEWAQGRSKAELVAYAEQALQFAGVGMHQTRPAIIEGIRAEMERREGD